MKIRSPPAKLRQRITDHFLIAFLNMQLASRNPFSGHLRADGCWLGFFLQGLLTHLLQHVLWLSPAPSQNFREHSRTYPYSQTPAISRGRIEGKGNTRGLGDWLSQSITFGNLAAAFGACFSRLQKASSGSDSGRCKDVLQDHGAWLSRSLTFGSSAASYEGQGDCPKAPPTTQGTEPEPNRNSLVPFSCRSPGGSGWQPFILWL